MIRKVLAVVACLLAPSVALADTCNTIGVYGAIALVVCPGTKGGPDLELAGRDACEPINVRGVCNAWIWNKADRAAHVLPMTERQLSSVTALWINKQSLLKVCARDGCFAGQVKK
jgi:hypothetical protein